ncbi:MAG: 2-amino-4-hydroxy-6-hydroxymethyldihydropteridine diphosphokinase [Alphaproteobacteria bacterium]|nr:2-amino-4-hydroxy-6-hydroxymethyldihydropteridine diphosphokinase [Rhodospirillales bacterium]MCW9045716.1 2-amino-4-hydroxy-6-hydroxymethyldihydropteridine diphosphokinase [Alphaproteobacteria bacterium]
MVFVGIGANLTNSEFKTPVEACIAAVETLRNIEGITVVQCSQWYQSEPIPKSDQPWYVNGVLHLETNLSADDLLQKFHEVEEQFGRVRTVRNAPRIIDIDLLDYKGIVKIEGLAQLPHPRMHERAFVLKPLLELSPNWKHPLHRKTAKNLYENLAKSQLCEVIEI